MLLIELLTKDDCSLCDKAKKIIRSVQLVYPFQLIEIDITEDPHLYQRYKEEIPVVRIEGKDVFRYKLSERAFLKKLNRADELKP